VATDVQPQVEEYRPVSKSSKPSKPKAENPVRSILFPVKKQRFFKVAQQMWNIKQQFGNLIIRYTVLDDKVQVELNQAQLAKAESTQATTDLETVLN
jgi:hypothetical protein